MKLIEIPRIIQEFIHPSKESQAATKACNGFLDLSQHRLNFYPIDRTFISEIQFDEDCTFFRIQIKNTSQTSYYWLVVLRQPLLTAYMLKVSSYDSLKPRLELNQSFPQVSSFPIDSFRSIFTFSRALQILIGHPSSPHSTQFKIDNIIPGEVELDPGLDLLQLQAAHMYVGVPTRYSGK